MCLYGLNALRSIGALYFFHFSNSLRGFPLLDIALTPAINRFSALAR